MLQKRCAFLEDILGLYCEEINRLTALHVPASSSRFAAAHGDGGSSFNDTAGLEAELSSARADAAHYYELYGASQKEVKHLTDDVAFLRTEQAKIVQKATDDFQRALKRNNERHDQAMRVLLQETELDRSRFASLEAELLQYRSDRGAQTAEEVMAAQLEIDRLEHELASVRKESASDNRRVAELERELAGSKRRVAHATEFMLQMEALGERVINSMVREAIQHKRLLNSLLMEDGQNEEGGDHVKVSFIDKSENGGGDDGAQSPTLTIEDQHRARILQKLATSNVSGSTTTISPGANFSATEKLSELLKQWEAEVEAQQLELAVAVRCANDQHQEDQRKTQANLVESYGHCEVLVQRIQQQDKQHAELKDFLGNERDKALDARDRAVVMVRAIEQANTRRAAVASVGVQTVRSEAVR